MSNSRITECSADSPARHRGLPALWVKWAVALGAIVGLVSCAGDGSELDGTGVPLNPPEIGIQEPSVTLTLVEGTSDSARISVTNVGGFPLEIHSLTATESFLRPLFSVPVLLGKNARHEFTIVVDAHEFEGAPYRGQVLIASNAKESPVVPVDITLTVTPAPEPEISISPGTLTVSVVEGLTDTISFEIANLGTADLIVTDVVSDAPNFKPLGFEFRVPPSSSTSVFVRIDAATEQPGLIEGGLVIVSNDEDEPFLEFELVLVVEYSGPFPATMRGVQTNVFDRTCLTPGCHTGPWAPLGLVLEEGRSWSMLYEIPSAWQTEMLLVKPYDPDNSYLITKLVEDDERRMGGLMPDWGLLEPETIDVIRRWIAEGALDN